MPIPGQLIIADIQGASYYQEYLAKVAKHQRYLAGETGSDSDSPTPKPTKAVKKPKPTAPKADPRPPVSKPVSSKQPEPKSAPTKTQGKKCKLTTEISDKPSKAIKSRPGLEPRVDDEEADVQRALEESLKSMYDMPQGLLSPVVIREPKSGKYQPLPEASGKGKEKVIEEQVARDLLTLQTPKKKSHADRYIFQRRTSTPTGSSRHDESSSLYAELGLIDSEEESKEDVSGANARGQGESQDGPDPGAQDEGQAGSNPDKQAEGQTVNTWILMLLISQHNLHLSKWMKGSLQWLIRRYTRISSSRLKNSDKPSEADNDKANAETEAESMVSVTIQQDMSSITPMKTPIIDLTSRPELEQRLDSHGARLYTLEQLDIPHQVSKPVDEVVMNAVDWAMQAPL
uniref:Histone deacetylase 14 n=1 Tax=Tanacetum cinerariifolium TaxID=118510 RepID=A0A699KZ46_TANCI|nr:hypothetical protein [Tanacetum cinerariifolium]